MGYSLAVHDHKFDSKRNDKPRQSSYSEMFAKSRGTSYLVAPINASCEPRMKKSQKEQSDFLKARNAYYLKINQPKIQQIEDEDEPQVARRKEPILEKIEKF